MTPITQPLVVGVDGTPSSDAALRFACGEASARRLPLAIMHAWQPFPAYATSGLMGPGPVSPAPVEMADAGQRVLDDAAAVADGFGPSVVHEQYLVEAAAPAALTEASEAALLVVVGGRDRARHEPGWLGPVPIRLAAKGHCPVIVVPSGANLTGGIVVGVDGSALSEDALGFAFDQASRRRVPLTAILAFAVAAPPAGLDMSLFAARRADAQRQLSEALSGWADKFPDVTVHQAVTDEAPLRALRSASTTASLVVVGTHGRGFILRHVLGSVSSALLRISDCAVAVVGHADESATGR
jgi:nucleotide-binding universal stress UspA family protein